MLEGSVLSYIFMAKMWVVFIHWDKLKKIKQEETNTHKLHVNLLTKIILLLL